MYVYFKCVKNNSLILSCTDQVFRLKLELELELELNINHSMTIKCFGIIRDITGTSDLNLEDKTFEGQSVGSLKQFLTKTYPDISELNALMVAVNQNYAGDDLILSSTDEIALIPPVAGG